MASNATIFFAGVGTTLIILGAGFGSGLFMANSALKEPASVQARAKEEVPAPIRVVLPSSAQAAEPKPVIQQAEQPAAPTTQGLAPVKEVQTPPDKEKTDKKADADKRRKRIAERKARRLAARRNHQEPPVLAYSGDEARSLVTSLNFNGN